MDRKYFKTAVSIFCLLFAGTSFASLNFNMPKSPKMPNVKAPSFKAPDIKGFKMPKSPKMPDLKGLSKATSYIPRIYLSGYAGSSYLGQADLLFPVLQRYDRNIFLYAQGRYSAVNRAWGNNPWEGGLGLGYREIFGHSWILGAYGLLDYNKTYSAKSVIAFDPGLEFLTKNWDVRLNGYIPVMNTKWSVSGWADQFGDYRYVSYKGHSELDHWYTYNVETGMGADAEVGRKLFTVWGSVIKGYLSGYYFAMQSNDSLMGGGAKITIQPTSYLKFKLEDTYDNYAKNTVMAGFEVSLYDLFSDASTKVNNLALRHKLYEPIERNFGQIGVGNSTPTTMYGDYFEHHTHHHDHGGGVEHNDIWFFNGSSNSVNTAANDNPAQDDGTYEHPYTTKDFNNTTLKEIAAYAKTKNYKTSYLYFNKGLYSAYNANGTPVEVFANDVVVGKMGGPKGFKYDATGSNRPQFFGALKLDSNTSISNIVLANMIGKFTTGITINNADNVTIKDVDVGSNDATSGYQNGIELTNSPLTITNSKIYGYSEKSDAVGIVVKNGGALSLNNSSIYGTSKKDGYGINVIADSDGCGSIGAITGSGTNSIQGTGAKGYGLYGAAGTKISIGDITNITFNGSTSGAHIITTGTGGSAVFGTITNSNFTGTSGDGLYIKSPSITIGDITSNQAENSEFSGGNNGVYLDGGTVKIGDIKHYDFTGNINGSGLNINSTNTTIKSISNANFKGKVDGLYIAADTGSGSVSIGDITGDSSKHSSVSGGTHGAYIKGNEVKLGNISGYDFAGQAADGNSGMAGLDIHASNSIKIGNITTSSFKGDQDGMLLEGTDSNKNLPTINIGNIGDDTGTSNTSFTGALDDGVRIYGNKVTINNIDSISATGGSEKVGGSGLYIKGTDITITNVIENSTFTGGAYGVDFQAKNISMKGESGDGNVLYELRERQNNNTFTYLNKDIGGNVRINDIND